MCLRPSFCVRASSSGLLVFVASEHVRQFRAECPSADQVQKEIDRMVYVEAKQIDTPHNTNYSGLSCVWPPTARVVREDHIADVDG